MPSKATANTLPQRTPWNSLARALRLIAVVVLSTVGCLALINFTFVHWIERQILTVDNWVATVSPLPQTPVVATALGNYVTTQIFANVPVKQEIANALPPKADFLASPLASQLQSLTNKIANRVIMSDNFQTIWVAANRTAMTRLVSNARGQTQPLGSKLDQKFNLNLNSIKNSINSKLGTSASALPSLNINTGKVLAVTTDLKTKREHVWQYIRTIDFMSAVLPLVMLASFLSALAFAYSRRRTLLTIAGVSVVLLLLQLIAIKSLRQEVLDQVKVSANQPAVSYIYDALTASLKNIIDSWLIAALVVIVLCVLAGPARLSVRLRALLRFNNLQGSKPLVWWRNGRLWVRQYQNFIWIGVGLLLLVWLAFAAEVTDRVLVNSLCAAISLIALVYIVAHPHKASRTAG